MLTPAEFEAEYLRCLRRGQIEQLDTLLESCDTDEMVEAMMRANDRYLAESDIPKMTPEQIEAGKSKLVQSLASEEKYEAAAFFQKAWFEGHQP